MRQIPFPEFWRVFKSSFNRGWPGNTVRSDYSPPRGIARKAVARFNAVCCEALSASKLLSNAGESGFAASRDSAV